MRETRDLEFKESVSDGFLKTVSALANHGGGRILFGVDDKGQEIGLSDPVGAALRIENKVNDAIEPRPEYAIRVDDDRGIVTLEVREGPHKPYLYRSKAYKRSDSATVPVDTLELGRLVLAGRNLAYDELEAPTQELSFGELEGWLRRVVGIGALSDDILRTLQLMGVDGTYNVAAELLADANSFPGVDVVRFGDSISVMRERRTFEHVSVLKQLDAALEMYRAYYRYDEVRGAERINVQLVPEEAFREAVANALVHRTWDVSAHVRISMHPDRIEVSSPGGLPAGLSEREYVEGQVSILRNPLLGGVFFRLRIIERFGTGIARIRAAYEKSAAGPRFEVFENSITVTLPVMDAAADLSGDELAVYRALADGRAMSSAQVAARAGFGKTKTVALLGALVERGYLRREGNGRGTTYALNR